jgi:hypothetical protein
MKRLAALLLLLVLALVPTGAAQAHMLSLAAAVSVSDGELTLRPLDVYGVALEGARVTAAPLLQGGNLGTALTLAEGPAGSYRTAVPAPGGGAVRLEVHFAEELYRVDVQVAAGESFAERLLPMQAIEPEPGFQWGPVLYGAAAVVLVTGTVYAMMRRRQAENEEEEEDVNG